MKSTDIFKNYLSHNKAFFENLKNKKAISKMKGIDFSSLTDRVHQEYDPIFVLSTGRNGTLLLTNLLSNFKNVMVYHEPEPELSMASKMAYEKHQLDSSFVAGMFEGARYELLRSSFLMNQKYIETNNRITFFAYEIAKLYPQSKFIHLVRHPASFIKSGLGRNWYSGNSLYDEARIVDKNNLSWSESNTYEKIAWLWNETNEFIEEFKVSIPSVRVLTIKSEEMFHSIEVNRSIIEFCGLGPISDAKINKTIRSKANAGKQVKIDESSLKSAIQNHCHLLKKYGYV